jgi:hypothetical protein
MHTACSLLLLQCYNTSPSANGRQVIDLWHYYCMSQCCMFNEAVLSLEVHFGLPTRVWLQAAAVTGPSLTLPWTC